MWRLTSLAAAVAAATGLLPWSDTTDVLTRMAPILVFLVSVTVLAELAENALVFDIAAREGAHLARGRPLLLFLLVAVLATATTALLGLDTTAVLLTPVVLALADQLRLDPLPFALLTVWLANTASLLLPVSNLTNLLALRRLHLEPHEFLARMWLPTAVAVLLTVLLLGLLYRAHLSGRYIIPAHPGVPDRVLFYAAALMCLALVPALLLGADPTVAVTVAAALLVAVFAARRPRVLRPGLVPWRLALLVLGLAVIVETVRIHGGDRLVAAVTGDGQGAAGLLQVAAVGAAASNVLNNLPAYLAVEPEAASSVNRLLALLVGTNVGPMVLLWGSLATLLWRERCRARGVHVSAWQFARLGLVGVPLVLVATTLSLLVT